MLNQDYAALALQIKNWGKALGFQQVGITDIQLEQHELRLQEWLDKGYQGDMAFLHKHGSKRSHPDELIPGTVRVICARMNYLPEICASSASIMEDQEKAFLSRYALGRDYHKVLRKRLQQLANKINEQISDHQYRVFVDSAPVLEKALAEKAGLGWIGKHTNLLHREVGSWFFLGEIYTNLPLPIDTAAENHCGSCTACINVCPTQAIIAPYVLDATRCISYLTIECKGSIPIALRQLMGNRIYGCDDCQLFCPWNRFAQFTQEVDFNVRHNLDKSTLLRLFGWSEEDFLRHTEGTAIRRISYQQWQRNLAVALGNGDYQEDTVQALESRRPVATDLVREHIDWAIASLAAKRS